MSLSFSNRTVAGRIVGQIETGREPLPWILIEVQYAAHVWDRYGNRAPVLTHERVIIQGAENIKALRPKLRFNVEILAMGQGVPGRVVAGDRDVRGQVTLASIIQFPEDKEAKSV